MLNRDSLTLKVLLLLSVVLGVLASITDPTLYGLDPVTGAVILNWIKLASVLVAAVSGWLQTSPLPGENDDKRVGGGGARSIVLPFLLVGSMLAGGCALISKIPDPAETEQAAETQQQIQATRAKAIQIAKAAESSGELLVRIVRATIAAREAGVPKAQTDVLMRAVDRLEPHGHDNALVDGVVVHTGICASTLLDAVEKATSEPELKRAVGALLDLVVPVLEAADATKDSTITALARQLRDAYAVASTFMGRDDELWAVDLGGAR